MEDRPMRIYLSGLLLCLNAMSVASPKINFYADPLATKPSQQLESNTPMATIITRGDWIKVGLKSSGDVGWIKQSELSPKPPETQSQTKSYSMSYHIEQKHVDGKTQTKAEGYRNGKKLSEEEVMALIAEQEATIKKQAEHMKHWFSDIGMPRFSDWMEDLNH